MLCGSQIEAMNSQENTESTEPTEKPKFQKFKLKFIELGEEYASNRTESILITAVQAGDLQVVREFFGDNEKCIHLRISGCIIALFAATQKDELKHIEQFLISQQIVQNILMNGPSVGLNKLFTLCALHEQNNIVLNILNDAAKFETIESVNVDRALHLSILNCADNLAQAFLAHAVARERLSCQALEEMLFLAREEPYYEKIQQLIAEKS